MKKQLASGFVLRSLGEGYASDREQLPDLYAACNTEGHDEDTKEGMRDWTRDLIYRHPTTTPDDVFVVVDPANGDKVVSGTLLIPQTWRYEDIDVAVGRPELVATSHEYRNRGLVRDLFDAVHERSAALGHQMQAITGIPYFYRKFGYTMAVELGTHAVFQLSALRDPDPATPPAYTLRRATADDIPDIMAWNDYFSRERLLTEHYSPDVLLYEITGRRQGYYPHTDYQIIIDTAGRGVGYLTLLSSLDEPYRIRCVAYVLGEEASHLATFHDVMQGVKAWALATHGYCPAMLSFATGFHDALDQLVEFSPGGLVRQGQDYAWFIRVADAIAFLRHIAPVLERRLHGSGAHRYTGDLRVGFYDLTGIRMVFENGRLADIEAIGGKDNYDAEFPWHMFWNVVFGHRTTAELNNLLADAYTTQRGAVVLKALFPKKQSWLHGLA